MYSKEDIQTLFYICKENLGTKESFDYSKKSFLFHCPNESCPTNIIGHSYKKDKLSITFEKNVCKCWVCEYADSIPKLAKKYFSSKDKKEVYSLQKKAVIAPPIKANKHENNNELYIVNTFKKIDFSNSILDAREYKLNENIINYLINNRGLTRDIIDKYSIMYCDSGKYNNCIIFPSHDKNYTINFFIAKNYITGRYMLPSIKKNDIIFNEYYASFNEELILVEGVFDYLALAPRNRVALAGSYISKTSKLFNRIIENNTPLVIILDEDATKKMYSIESLFISYGIKVKSLNISEFNVKDVGEILQQKNANEIKNNLFNKIDSIEYSNSRLNVLYKKLQQL